MREIINGNFGKETICSKTHTLDIVNININYQYYFYNITLYNVLHSILFEVDGDEYRSND